MKDTTFIARSYHINKVLSFIIGDTELSQLFNIGVGYVSGAETIMKNPKGTLKILKNETTVDTYYDF